MHRPDEKRALTFQGARFSRAGLEPTSVWVPTLGDTKCVANPAIRLDNPHQTRALLNAALKETGVAIVPYLKGRVFDPEAIEAMSSALDDICHSLNLPRESAAVREVIALRIIELAEHGERNAERLRDGVLANANLGQFAARTPRPLGS